MLHNIAKAPFKGFFPWEYPQPLRGYAASPVSFFRGFLSVIPDVLNLFIEISLVSTVTKTGKYNP